MSGSGHFVGVPGTLLLKFVEFPIDRQKSKALREPLIFACCKIPQPVAYRFRPLTFPFLSYFYQAMRQLVAIVFADMIGYTTLKGTTFGRKD
jgi:hypothetical protein